MMRRNCLALFGLLFASLLSFGSAAADKSVLILGDSLTAGFGLAAGDSFPAQLERWLKDQGHPIRILNAGVSGDTTTGGLARLAWVLDGQQQVPDLVVVELGGNDVLRAVPPAVTRANMVAIAETLANRDIPVMIAGMLAAPNLGPDYAARFNPIFADVAADFGAALYPFFLDGVADRPDLHQPDGIHPNAEGVKELVKRFGPALLQALKALPEKKFAVQ